MGHNEEGGLVNGGAERRWPSGGCVSLIFSGTFSEKSNNIIQCF